MTIIFVTHDIDEAVLLGDRVCVMGNRPASIVQEIAVPLGRPRGYEDLETETFLTTKRAVLAVLCADAAGKGPGLSRLSKITSRNKEYDLLSVLAEDRSGTRDEDIDERLDFIAERRGRRQRRAAPSRYEPDPPGPGRHGVGGGCADHWRRRHPALSSGHREHLLSLHRPAVPDGERPAVAGHPGQYRTDPHRLLPWDNCRGGAGVLNARHTAGPAPGGPNYRGNPAAPPWRSSLC